MTNPASLREGEVVNATKVTELQPFKNWRLGQTCFNVLYEVAPEIADRIRATADDPFYRDDKLHAFFFAVLRIVKEDTPDAAREARVKELEEALRNLIFTASKLWDEVKPIKDGPALRITHPIIEDARAALANTQESQT